jgi:BirA family biotin operon repressor/biotin-[acetyl-CoA-carboxylase] ligase
VNESTLCVALSGLPVPSVHYFAQIGSTNDYAQMLLEQGAPDGTLVVADAQIQGRGRLGRRWVTTSGAALAFSLALRPNLSEQEQLAFFSPLAGLAVCKTLMDGYGLPAEVKWPNDVLLNRRKVCGVLVEAVWLGSHLQGVVVGIGINVTLPSVPPDCEVLFPATCVEQVLGRPLEREALLAAILRQFFALRPSLGSVAFRQDWQARLAFRGQGVRVDLPGTEQALTGQVIGIDEQGNLRLRTPSGEEVCVTVGDVRLRPL